MDSAGKHLRLVGADEQGATRTVDAAEHGFWYRLATTATAALMDVPLRIRATTTCTRLSTIFVVAWGSRRGTITEPLEARIIELQARRLVRVQVL